MEMTREEMIKWLKKINTKPYSDFPYKPMNEALEMAIKVLEQTRWIPVSKKMPEPQKNGDKDYSDWLQVTILIGKNKDAYVGEAYYCFSENKWYAKRFAVGEVTAWKPLSEPYKAESEGEE